MINCLRRNNPALVELEKLEARCGVQQFLGVDSEGIEAVYSGRCVQSKRPGTTLGMKPHGGQHRAENGYMWDQSPDWDFWFDYTEDDFLVPENKERFRK